MHDATRSCALTDAMPEFFHLGEPESERLLASTDEAAPYQVRRITCPLNPDHNHSRPTSPVALQVKHNKQDEWMISSWLGERVVHQALVAEFEKRKFTGYRLKPATVRFRDGALSSDYSELIVVGWAGVAPPESGIHLIDECPGCMLKHYSGLQDAERLIDWNQWTGEDFFVVWPLPAIPLITKRVAEALGELQVKSYRLGGVKRFE